MVAFLFQLGEVVLLKMRLLLWVAGKVLAVQLTFELEKGLPGAVLGGKFIYNV